MIRDSENYIYNQIETVSIEYGTININRLYFDEYLRVSSTCGET